MVFTGQLLCLSLTELKSNNILMLKSEDKNILSIFTKPWFIEGLFYTTGIALLWSNEEPSKLNTLLAAWSSYGIVALVLFKATRSGTILQPEKWIRVYFIQTLLVLVACEVWLRGSIPRAEGFYTDQVRYDYWAAVLSQSGMRRGVIAGQNYAGVIWYAGFIYWIFGISKFYVALFNGALIFTTCVLFTSVMKNIEGNAVRWQFLRFGCILPDFIIHCGTVAKEPLSTFVAAVGVWIIARAVVREKPTLKIVLPLFAAILVGLAVRAVTSAIIIVVASIWLWKYWDKRRRIVVVALLCTLVVAGYFATNYVMDLMGSAQKDWPKTFSNLIDPESRKYEEIDYSARSSWNVITETAPIYLMPIVAPVKGFFMMIGPMPIWDLPITEILDNIGSKTKVEWYNHFEVLCEKLTAWLFVFSTPFLLAALFDVYRRNRRIWITTCFTFIVLIVITGFLVRGVIVPRYRLVYLPFWLITCGAGFYYGRPRRYVLVSIGIVIVGFAVYMVPKLG